jgi:hypothetical protein
MRRLHTLNVILSHSRSVETLAPCAPRSALLVHSWLAALLACSFLAACQRSTTSTNPGASKPSTAQKPPLTVSPGTSLASLQNERPARDPKPGTRLATSDHCSAICARSAPLGCVGASECQSYCEEMATSIACRAEMTAVLDCFAEQPTENWECAAQGLPSLREGHCSPEQAAYRDCRAASEP